MYHARRWYTINLWLWRFTDSVKSDFCCVSDDGWSFIIALACCFGARHIIFHMHVVQTLRHHPSRIEFTACPVGRAA